MNLSLCQHGQCNYASKERNHLPSAMLACWSMMELVASDRTLGGFFFWGEKRTPGTKHFVDKKALEIRRNSVGATRA